MPPWATDHSSVQARTCHEVTGEDLPWALGLRDVYRALAAPTAGEAVVEAPRSPLDVDHQVAYWTPLLHLLVYGLGWSDPAAGLVRWDGAGRPAEPGVLALLAALWSADGGLEGFGAWVDEATPFLPVLHELRARVGLPRGDVVRRAPDHWQVVRDEVSDGPGSTFARWRGSDPLHLGGHLSMPLGPSRRPARMHLGSDGRSAVLTLPTMAGWYRALLEHGTGLPPTSRSWRVQVVVPPVGHLGVFRLSRETGLWFSGRHRWHSAGN